MSAKTIFSRNVNPVNRKTILESPIKPIQVTGTGADIYKPLSDFTKKLDYLFLLFSQGQFRQIMLILTRNEYNALASQLLDLSNTDPVYEQIRTTIARSLEGLYQGVLQYILLINTEYKLIIANEKASILDDMCKLREYLEHMKETLCILPDTEVSVVSAAVKPEYLKYIEHHGYPRGGVFEADKMAEILRTIQMSDHH